MQQDINNQISLFIDALVEGKRTTCSEIAMQLLKENPSIINLYEGLLKESLYKVGELWEYNKISVATEHMATAIIESILNTLYPQIISSGEINNKKVILACIEDEYHQVGIKMVSDMFEMYGWESLYLGANVPFNELLSFIEEIEPDVLAISLSIYFHLPLLKKMLESLNQQFPDLNIIIGGQAFRHLEDNDLANYKNVTLIMDLLTLSEHIKKITYDQG
ncbi:MAG: cobalamin-dependent protein [Bacteroidales bacterium]|nr:cobalamin-dependent protein [Bacteroidales bacterium]